MTQQEFDNIKERYEKLYIVASEAEHQIIKIMQRDITDLMKAVKPFVGIDVESL